MEDGPKLTPEAMRAARALLGLPTVEAAARIGISATTLNQIEAGAPIRPSTVRKVAVGLAQLGVEILSEDGWTGARIHLTRGASPPTAREDTASGA